MRQLRDSRKQKRNTMELDWLREKMKHWQRNNNTKKKTATQGRVLLCSVCNRKTESTHIYSVINVKLRQFRCIVKQWSLWKYSLSCFSEISFEIKELNFQLPFLTITPPTIIQKTKQNTKTAQNVIVNNERGISQLAFPILFFFFAVFLFFRTR